MNHNKYLTNGIVNNNYVMKWPGYKGSHISPLVSLPEPDTMALIVDGELAIVVNIHRVKSEI